jgi:hypothetical protein
MMRGCFRIGEDETQLSSSYKPYLSFDFFGSQLLIRDLFTQSRNLISNFLKLQRSDGEEKKERRVIEKMVN